MALQVKGAHRFTSFPLTGMAEEDSLILAWKQTGYGCDSFVFCVSLGCCECWSLCGGRKGGKSQLLQQDQLWGLLCWAVGVQGAPSHSRFISPQIQSVLAVFSGPFGWTFSLWVIRDVSVPNG